MFLFIEETKNSGDFLDHTIVHFEIPAEDVEKLKKFYQELFGWKMEKYPGPTTYYTVQTVPTDDKMMPTRAGVNGGLYPKKDAQDPANAKQINYIFGWSQSTNTARRLKNLAEKSRFLKWKLKG
jgi:predicted enzyme related to lactoylglutathione lyase